MSEAPRYLVTERSYIGLGVVEAGGEVEYYGEPGSALEPLNAAAEKAKAAVPEKQANPTQYIIDDPGLTLRPVRHAPKPVAKTGRDPTGQGAIRDPGGELDPAAPFDPAVQGPDHTPVHLPQPAEDAVTPGREKTQAKNRVKAAQAAAKRGDEPPADLT